MADRTRTSTSAPASPGTLSQATDRLAALIGDRVRARRRELRMSRRELSERSEVSQRYLAQVESGHGNVSVALLTRIGSALGRPVAWFVSDDADVDEATRVAERYTQTDIATRSEIRRLLGFAAPRAGRVALIGLRGAGKSTLGRRASAALSLPFVELNNEIEAQAGMTVADIMALYGQDGYRRLEHQALLRTAERHDALILAVAGGIVGAPETYALLRERFLTIWLRASPDEHMARVRAQGDERPMAGNPAAMDALRSILNDREQLYAQADAILDTAGRDENRSLGDLVAILKKTGTPPMAGAI